MAILRGTDFEGALPTTHCSLPELMGWRMKGGHETNPLPHSISVVTPAGNHRFTWYCYHSQFLDEEPEAGKHLAHVIAFIR